MQFYLLTAVLQKVNESIRRNFASLQTTFRTTHFYGFFFLLVRGWKINKRNEIEKPIKPI